MLGVADTGMMLESQRSRRLSSTRPWWPLASISGAGWPIGSVASVCTQ
jgi:hypothetical protein